MWAQDYDYGGPGQLRFYAGEIQYRQMCRRYQRRACPYSRDCGYIRDCRPNGIFAPLSREEVSWHESAQPPRSPYTHLSAFCGLRHTAQACEARQDFRVRAIEVRLASLTPDRPATRSPSRRR